MNAEDYLLRHADEIQDAAFFGVIIIAALWEVAAPFRELAYSLRIRWLSNIGLAVFNTVIVRGLMAAAGVSVAATVENYDWGLLTAVSGPPLLLSFVGAAALDLAKYLEHQAVHRVPLLWRLHQVHHADLDVDFTTAYRHHPLEAIFSTGVYVLVIAGLGVSLPAVVLFEALSAVVAVFAHTNVHLPPRLERLLRLAIITPEMHGVHHSAVRRETDSNYGNIFPWWDRLFASYVARPAAGYRDMTVGLEYSRDPKDLYPQRVLAMPFRKRDV